MRLIEATFIRWLVVNGEAAAVNEDRRSSRRSRGSFISTSGREKSNSKHSATEHLANYARLIIITIISYGMFSQALSQLSQFFRSEKPRGFRDSLPMWGRLAGNGWRGKVTRLLSEEVQLLIPLSSHLVSRRWHSENSTTAPLTPDGAFSNVWTRCVGNIWCDGARVRNISVPRFLTACGVRLSGAAPPDCSSFCSSAMKASFFSRPLCRCCVSWLTNSHQVEF